MMATVFWCVHGVLLVDFTPPGSTINAATYQAILKRPGLLIKGLGVLLLYDNAQPHSAAATVNVLNSWGWEILTHPLYSPDLAPSDFHLVFPKSRSRHRGQRFHSNEDVQNEVTKWLCPGCIFSKKVTCPGCIFL
jgi:transposase